MIIAIVLTAAVFIVLNHAKKKYVKIFLKGRGNVRVLEGETVKKKKKERIVLFIDSRRRLFWNQIAK